MRGTIFAGAVLAAAAAVRASTPGVVQWDIGRRNPHPRLRRRSTDSTDLTTINNSISTGGYLATCKVGTPSQTVRLQLDTGSSDVWIPSSDASICTTSGCSLGSFNSNTSTSYTVVGKDKFSISYVDGSKSQGDYFSDVFTIGSSSLSNLTMGLGESTDIAFGLVGLGYTTNEAIVSTQQSLSAAYDNLPVVMVKEGLIKSNAYSLWLNDLDASTGQILFGGIDTDKYKGNLTSINIYQTTSGVYSSFLVAFTSMVAVSDSGTDTLTSREFPIPVVLDSGTTLTYVPTDLAKQIWTEAGAVYNSQLGLAIIPCSKASSTGYFSFAFAGPGGPTINVTMDELVLDLTSSGTATFSSGPYKGQEACEFGIQNSSSDPFLLGDTFLRSAYVVYDLANNKIGIAPTNFNATSSNIVAFASSGAAIPSATTAPHQDQVTSSSTFTTPAYAASSGFGSSSSSVAALAAPMDVLHVFLVTAAMFVTGTLFVL